MDDLRNEIRQAFQKEQAANPPGANLRHDVVAATTTRPRRGANLQWLAAAAALLITALVIGSLVSSRVALRTQAPAHASPARTAAPANGDYGPPPEGVALFYLKDPEHQGWYVGFDWTGTPRATLKLPAGSDPNMSLSQSADGSYFILRPGAKGGSGQFYDKLGQRLSGNGGFAGAQWADDNSHQCGMYVDESAGTWNLVTQVPGQPAKKIATLAPYSAGAQWLIELLACSYHTDKAVLVKVANSYPVDLWVIRLSDGKVLAHTAYTDNAAQYGAPTASRDASLVALNSSKASGGTNWFGPTTVVRALDGGLVAKLDASFGVLGFSSDNKSVLVTTTPWVFGAPTHLAVVAIPSGDILWRYDGPEQLTGFFTNPAGPGFAVMLQSPAEPAGPHPTVDVVIVNGTDEPLIVASHYMRP
jgi:hypothetical protein